MAWNEICYKYYLILFLLTFLEFLGQPHSITGAVLKVCVLISYMCPGLLTGNAIATKKTMLAIDLKVVKILLLQPSP